MMWDEAHFRSQLARFTDNDPTETEVFMGEYRYSGQVLFDDDAYLALGSALQKSTHVTNLNFDISSITSIQGCSTMETFLKSTKSLRKFSIYSKRAKKRQQLTAEITDRFFTGLQENTPLQELTISYTSFSCQTLSHLLTKLNQTLQKLALRNVALASESDSFVHEVGKAIYKCQSLKEINLGGVPVSLMVPILKIGVSSHPSLRRLELQFWEEEMPDEVAEALRHTFQFSGLNLGTLFVGGPYVTPNIMQSITDGLRLQRNPIIKTLLIYNCDPKHPMTVQAITNLLSPSSVQLRSLVLDDFTKDPIFQKEIISALCHNTSIQNLDLTGCGISDAHTIALLQNVLARPNNSIAHLRLWMNSLGSEQGANLIRTAIQTLTTLDCRDCHLNDTFVQALVKKPPPLSDHPNRLKSFCFSGDEITDQGMSSFLSYLQQHATQLKCLRFADYKFGNAGAARLDQFLNDKNCSLEHLVFEECDGSDAPTFQKLQNILGTAMDSHPTLKSLSFGSVELEKFNILFSVLEIMMRACQLSELDMHAYWANINNRDEDEEDSQSIRLLDAFNRNTSLTNVTLSEDNNIFSTVFHEKLEFYGKRNANFLPLLQTEPQPVIDSHKKLMDWDFSTFDNVEDSDGVHVSGFHGDSAAKFPLTLWPHILEAAHKQYPHASMLHQLLSSRLGLLCAGAWEGSVPTKRDHS